MGNKLEVGQPWLISEYSVAVLNVLEKQRWRKAHVYNIKMFSFVEDDMGESSSLNCSHTVLVILCG